MPPTKKIEQEAGLGNDADKGRDPCVIPTPSRGALDAAHELFRAFAKVFDNDERRLGEREIAKIARCIDRHFTALRSRLESVERELQKADGTILYLRGNLGEVERERYELKQALAAYKSGSAAFTTSGAITAEGEPVNVPAIGESAIEDFNAVADGLEGGPTIRDLTAKLAASERVREQLAVLVETISEQQPEKPDYWNSCGQCERNIEDAKELYSAHRGKDQP